MTERKYLAMRDMHVLDLRDLKAELMAQRDTLNRRIKRCNNLIAAKLYEIEKGEKDAGVSDTEQNEKGHGSAGRHEPPDGAGDVQPDIVNYYARRFGQVKGLILSDGTLHYFPGHEPKILHPMDVIKTFFPDMDPEQEKE